MIFVQYYSPESKVMVSGVGMAGLSEKADDRQVKSVHICGDRHADGAQAIPMAPRVTNAQP